MEMINLMTIIRTMYEKTLNHSCSELQNLVNQGESHHSATFWNTGHKTNCYASFELNTACVGLNPPHHPIQATWLVQICMCFLLNTGGFKMPCWMRHNDQTYNTHDAYIFTHTYLNLYTHKAFSNTKECLCNKEKHPVAEKMEQRKKRKTGGGTGNGPLPA